MFVLYAILRKRWSTYNKENCWKAEIEDAALLTKMAYNPIVSHWWNPFFDDTY